jgi:hypothetical protein
MIVQRAGLILLFTVILASGCGGGSGQHEGTEMPTTTATGEDGTTDTGDRGQRTGNGGGGAPTTTAIGEDGTTDTGDRGQRTGNGGGGAPTTTATGEDGTTDTGDGGEEPDYLKRRDLNKGDVAGLLSFAIPRVLCGPGVTENPDITVNGTMEGSDVALESVLICLSRFTPMGAADAEVTFPDSSTKQLRVSLDEDGNGGLPVDALSGAGAGRYEVTAADETDPSKTAAVVFYRATFTVSPKAAPAGTTFAIAVAGFAPNVTVPIYLYESTPCPFGHSQGCWAFRAYLPELTIDEAGNADFDLVTRPDDKATSYCLMLGTFSKTTPCRARFRVDPA